LCERENVSEINNLKFLII
jgi:hypothetical protein